MTILAEGKILLLLAKNHLDPGAGREVQWEETEIFTLLWQRQNHTATERIRWSEHKNERGESVEELLRWAEGQAIPEWSQLTRRELRQK